MARSLARCDLLAERGRTDTDLSAVSRQQLVVLARHLNALPRKCPAIALPPMAHLRERRQCPTLYTSALRPDWIPELKQNYDHRRQLYRRQAGSRDWKRSDAVPAFMNLFIETGGTPGIQFSYDRSE
ncbi:hypothetical protein QN219_12390 [Sinorhizobium sp. 7-81]|uniref:hypothetical protein n=1 Tax=Sinorhizobium sp. 8-89 TaxID=3049089 RepID=UPI0024C290BB|nr:hypothetical protein [Sinorhizobium sp. 8-89]MDK1490860.1 hypothetical protein [Sinorhizobium sp. 8-89]